MADLYRDFVFTRCTTPVGTTDTAISVEDVSLFPSNNVLARGEFYVAFESSLSYPHTFEICRLTSVTTATKTLNLVRAQGGTTAQSHAIVTYIKGTLTADMVRRARQGFAGTTAPSPDADVFVQGDRFYNSTENRYYAFTGKAGWLVDTFTRAASTTTLGSTETVTTTVGTLPPVGTLTIPYVGTWQYPSGVWGVNASGQAYYVSGAVSNAAVALLNVGGTDFDISFDVFASTTAGSDYGIVFRYNGDNTYGYYLQFSGTTATLYRVNNGTFATTSQTTTYTTGSAHTWRITAVGNVITVYRDGTSVISYTEAVTAMLVATGNIGAAVGMRIGNAAGITDTALYWDNFRCTTPSNTAPNTPTPQGWAPTSGFTGSNDPAGYALNVLSSVESTLAQTVSQLDDAIAADANVETTVQKHGVDLDVIAATVDDWLQVIQDHETRIASQANTDVVIATQVDEITDTLGSAQLNVVRSTNVDTPATAGEFIIATAGGYGATRNLTASYESFGVSYAATPSTITFTQVAASALIVSFRGTWTYYSSTSSLDGVAQTEQARFDGNSAQGRLFTSVPGIASGSHTMTFTGGGGANIYFAYDVVIPNASTTGAGYIGTTSTSGTLTSALNHVIVVYVQSNAGTITTPTATGLTFTQLDQNVSGNSNRAGLYYAINTTGATSVTISTGAASGYNGFVAGSFGGSGIVPSYTAVTLPTPVKNASVQVMNYDVAAPVKVLGSLATGAPAVLTGQFSRGSYIADGTSWYGTISGPESGSVVTKTAAYTANYGDTVLANATTSAFAVTLPAASLNTMVMVKKVDLTSNVVTVTAIGTSKIDGNATFTLTNPYDSVSLVSDGTNWWLT